MEHCRRRLELPSLYTTSSLTMGTSSALLNREPSSLTLVWGMIVCDAHKGLLATC